MRVIATSRERLRLAGESAWTVPPLGLPRDDAMAASSEAVQLFLERAALVAPGLVVDHDGLDAIVAICRRVEAVPLAIELAAARVRMMSVQDLRARLDQHWDILSGGDRDALPHQRSLRATIDWSHSLLSPLAQGVLHRLAVFRGGFELVVGRARARGQRRQATTRRSTPCKTSSTRASSSSITTPVASGSSRPCATTRSNSSRRPAWPTPTRRAHATHFVDVLRDVEDRIVRVDEQRNALLLVAHEHDNIVAALTWSLEHDHTIAGQLVGYSFGPWYGLGQPEAPTVVPAARCPSSTSSRARAALRACNAVGVILGYLGDKDIAFPLLDRAVAVARTFDDVEMLAMALSLNASIRHAYQELDAALPMTREAMAIPITSERHLIRAWVCSSARGSCGPPAPSRKRATPSSRATSCASSTTIIVVRSSTLDAIDLMAPDYMTSDQTVAERLDERDWLHQAGVAEDAATIVRTDGWSFLRERAMERGARVRRALADVAPEELA